MLVAHTRLTLKSVNMMLKLVYVIPLAVVAEKLESINMPHIHVNHILHEFILTSHFKRKLGKGASGSNNILFITASVHIRYNRFLRIKIHSDETHFELNGIMFA